MRIQNNITAMNTHRQLGINSTNLGKSTEKLSSGFRINRAADDAAGLSISEKMRSQIRGLGMASKNAQDGISLIQAAEGALQETHSIIQRMRELSVQAANDVNESIDRAAIQDEMNQLASEVDRIAYTTEFNKKTLLDGSLTNGSTTAKTIAGSNVKAGINAGKVDAGVYNIEVATAGVKAKVSFSFDLKGAKEGELVNIAFSGALDNTVTGTDNIADKFIGYTFTATGDVAKDNANAVNGLKNSLSLILKDFDVTTEGNDLFITAKEVGVAGKDALSTVVGFDMTATAADGVAGTIDTALAAAVVIDTGADAVVKVDGDDSNVTQVVGNTYKVSDVDGSGNDMTFTVADVTRLSSAVVQVSKGNSLTLQVGANTSVDQTIGIAVDNLSAAKLGIDNLSVHSNEAGRAAVGALDLALQKVSNQRSALGAVQNRLEHTVANLDTVNENLSAAESRIRDTDMAKEMMNFTKNNILIQASTAMLAQANQQPQTVLQLLQ